MVKNIKEDVEYLFVLPVLNEEKILAKSVKILIGYLSNNWDKKAHEWKIVIANNGSTDKTASVAQELEKRFPDKVKHLFIKTAGRGNALKEVLGLYDPKFLLYSDIDLPVDPEEFPLFLRQLEKNEADIVIGKRKKGNRPFRRKVLSHTLRLMTNLLFGFKLNDVQCGVKAFGRKSFDLFKSCFEKGYFLDTEILVLGKSAGMRIQEVEITWIDERYPERKSKISFFRDSWKGLSAMYRISNRKYPNLPFSFLSLLSIGTLITALFAIQKKVLTLADFGVVQQVPGWQNSLSENLMIPTLGASVLCLAAISYNIKKFPWKIYLVLGLLFFMAISIVAIWTNPTRSQDLYWNLALGKAYAVHDLNPYVTSPQMLSSDPWTKPVLVWRNLPMTHGPLWTLLMAAIAKLGLSLQASIIATKMVMFSALSVSIILLWRIMDMHGFSKEKKAALLVFFAWNPFVIQNCLVDVHSDLLMMLSILSSYYFLMRKKYSLSIISLILGGFIKYTSLLLLPIPLFELISQKKTALKKKFSSLVIVALIGLALGLALYYPFGGITHENFAGVSDEIAERGSYNQHAFIIGTMLLKVFLKDLSDLRLAGLVIGVYVLFIFYFRKKDILSAFAYPYLFIFFFATPWFQPWYALWVFPLLMFLWPIKGLAILSLFLVLIPETIDQLNSSTILFFFFSLYFIISQLRKPFLLIKNSLRNTA